MKQALKKSIALHLLVFFLFWIDLPLFWSNKMTLNQVPIIVDLQDVKISEMTNLPPKAKFGKEDKPATQKQKKAENSYSKDEPEEAPQQKPKETAKEKAEAKEDRRQNLSLKKKPPNPRQRQKNNRQSRKTNQNPNWPIR